MLRRDNQLQNYDDEALLCKKHSLNCRFCNYARLVPGQRRKFIALYYISRVAVGVPAKSRKREPCELELRPKRSFVRPPGIALTEQALLWY